MTIATDNMTTVSIRLTPDELRLIDDARDVLHESTDTAGLATTITRTAFIRAAILQTAAKLCSSRSPTMKSRTKQQGGQMEGAK